MPVTARTVRAHGGSLLIACRVLSTSSVVLNPPTSTEENILSKREVDVGDGVDESISGGPSGFLRESIVGDAVGCQDGGWVITIVEGALLGSYVGVSAPTLGDDVGKSVGAASKMEFVGAWEDLFWSIVVFRTVNWIEELVALLLKVRFTKPSVWFDFL